MKSQIPKKKSDKKLKLYPIMVIQFESKDLYMKNLTMDDFPGFFELQSDPDVMKYTGKSLLKQSVPM